MQTTAHAPNPLTAGALCLLALSQFAACLDGGGATETTTPGGGPVTAAKTRSFFPAIGAGSDALPARMTWTYLINQGKPVAQVQDGVQLTMSFGAAEVALERESGVRTSTVRASLGGRSEGVPVSGNMDMTITERLTAKDGQTLITGGNSTMNMTLTIEGERVQLASDIEMDYAQALPYFPDRDDLDSLPVGHRAGGGAVDVTYAGSVSISALGQRQSEPVSESGSAREDWEVLEVLDKYEVLGRSYREVVVLRRSFETMAGPGDNDGAGKMWVARGIGIIKTESVSSGTDEPVLWELEASNLLD